MSFELNSVRLAISMALFCVSSVALAQKAPHDSPDTSAPLAVPDGYDAQSRGEHAREAAAIPPLVLELDASPPDWRHRSARRAALWTTTTGLLLGAAGGVAWALCTGEGDFVGLGCLTAASLTAFGYGALFAGGAMFVYGTHREARAMSRAGIRISRVRGVLAAIFYALPYTQLIGVILAARQMRFNRRAIERHDNALLELRPRYY